jgi:coenzyme A diphosphatase NUDT7
MSLDFLKNKFSKLHKPNYYEQLLVKNSQISKLKRASVLIPISIQTEVDPETGAVEPKSYFTLTKRTETMKSFKGEVCFAGGRRDETDTNEAHTAYREAKEECNIEERDTVLLAELCPIITFNQILITPVIVYFDKSNFKPVLAEAEVDMIFDLPTERFLSNHGHEMQTFKNSSGEYHIHYFKDNVQGREIVTWGFTAFLSICVSMILNERAAEFDLVPNRTFKSHDMNSYLEEFLFNKLAVSTEYFKKHENEKK